VVLGKMKNEDSKGLRRLYRGGVICSQVPRHFTIKKTPQQMKKTGKTTQKTH